MDGLLRGMDKREGFRRRSTAYPLSRNMLDSGNACCCLIENNALLERKRLMAQRLAFLHDDKLFRDVSMKTKHFCQTIEPMRKREGEALGTVALSIGS